MLLADGVPEDDVALLVVAPAAVLGPHLDLVLPAEPARLVDLRRALTRWLARRAPTTTSATRCWCACSEAATNAVEHAYGPGPASYQVVGDWDQATGVVSLTVRDWGRWRSPRGQDRGRGIDLMNALMDEVTVDRGGPSADGTCVQMRRQLAGRRHLAPELRGRRRRGAGMTVARLLVRPTGRDGAADWPVVALLGEVDLSNVDQIQTRGAGRGAVHRRRPRPRPVRRRLPRQHRSAAALPARPRAARPAAGAAAGRTVVVPAAPGARARRRAGCHPRRGPPGPRRYQQGATS